MAVRKGLGRGLDALIPNNNAAKKQAAKPVKKKEAKEKTVRKEEMKSPEADSSQDETVTVNSYEYQGETTVSAENTGKSEAVDRSGVLTVNITLVEPNRAQPRKNFDEDALLELSESIRQYGVLQPILVSDKKDYYEIIAGERRWRAAKLAGLKEVPVIIKELSAQEIVEISLIENIQREDLNPIEEAKAYRRLMDEFSLKQDEIAERVSRSRTAVTNSMRLLKLEEKVQQMLIDEMISSGHARAILAIPSGEMQYKTALQVFDQKLSVRDTEKMVKKILDGKKEKTVKKSNPAEDAIYEGLEERIKGILGTKVNIQRKANHKGKIEIEYYSQDELDRIIDLLGSIQ